MLKRLSLVQKIVLSTCIVLLITFAVINTIALKQIYNYSQEQGETIASFTSKYNSEKLERRFEKVITIAKDISIQTETMVTTGNQSREFILSMIENTLNLHDDIFGIAVSYEPNKFDNKDIEYINKKGSNSKGQFMPYITRTGDHEFSTELSFYSHYSEKETKWYDIPKETHEIYLTEPTTYDVQGKPTTIASIVVPIIRNDEFVGVVSVDTSLDYLQKEIEKVRPLGGFSEIVSTGGIYVASGEDFSKVLHDVSNNAEWGFVLDRTTKGEEFTKYGNTPSAGGKTLEVYSTINIKDTNQYWTYVSIIPFSNILENFNLSFKIILFVGLILFVFIAYVNYSIISKDL